MLSLLLFYMAVELCEQKDSERNQLQKTIEFVLHLLESLKTSGMEFFTKNKIFNSLICTDGVLEENEKIEALIVEKFLYLEPIAETERGNYLLGDYYYMLSYMCSFPDVCIQLIRRADNSSMEIIKQKHILYLVNLLLDLVQDNNLGFHKESLYRVRDILNERYSIQF